MEKKEVKNIAINSYLGEVVLLEGIFYKYSSGEAFVQIKYVDIDKNSNLLDLYKRRGFAKLDDVNTGIVDLTIENILKCRQNDHVDFALLLRALTPSEVTEFFSYKVTIQLCGKHITTFYPLMDYVTTVDENIVTFLTYEGNSKAIFGKFGSEADALFGPQYPTKSAIFINDFRTTYEYRRPITDIEKIFLTKRYRDLEVIGTEKDYRYNGKVEVLELDLHNPDMAVYAQMRAIDNCIEVEWRDE